MKMRRRSNVIAASLAGMLGVGAVQGCGAMISAAAPYQFNPRDAAAAAALGDALTSYETAEIHAQSRRDAARIRAGGSSATGNIEKVWVEHNTYNGGSEKGMRIHTKFSVKNHRGLPVRLAAYFYERNGNKLWDDDGSFSTRNGQVSVGSDILRPPYDNTIWKDNVMFFPYDQLDINQKGKHRLKFDVWLWDKSSGEARKLDESDWIGFVYTE